MASQEFPDNQDVLARAGMIVDRILIIGQKSTNSLAWSLRRSRLDQVARETVEQKAIQSYEALFGAGHSGLVFVTSKVAVQEEAQNRLAIAFEHWAQTYSTQPSCIYAQLEGIRLGFGKSICKIGKYCCRVDALFNAQVSLIVAAVACYADQPDVADILLDFVENIFLQGMLPLGFEKTPAGLSLQVFVCD